MANDIESFGIENSLFPNNTVSCIGGREENQDSTTILETRRGLLVLVCDGMGGMAGGATASATAVNVISEYVSRPESEDDIDDDNRMTLIKAISEANSRLLQMEAEEPALSGMGTTVTALLINEEKATVAYVGDSRIYQIRRGRKVFRTFDHSMVFEMVRKKIITEEQARLSAQSNIILRALGQKPEIEVDAFDLPYDKGDLFLLCSDGIWGTLPEKELLRRLSTGKHPKVLTETLAMNIHNDAIRSGGGHDNLTAAMVRTTKDSKLRTKMEDKIKIALLSSLVLLLVSITCNIVLGYKLNKSAAKVVQLQEQIDKIQNPQQEAQPSDADAANEENKAQ
ncbi:MAG: serine/threonine-protein phosphatase [Bacteroidales bacterium]|nr:serine/threonine-protein phosphatase [Bacteroidales bacterium]